MAELILEPYSVRLRWQIEPSLTSQKWKAIICKFVETLARRCDEAGKCVIGHIKGLAMFSGDDYLQVSIISPERPADVSGAAPPGCSELALTLNVLVYGLPRDVLERLVREVVTVPVLGKRGLVSVEPVFAASSQKPRRIKES